MDGVEVNGYKIEPGADLRGANFEGVEIEVADLREANLQGTNFQGAYLGGACLKEANLQGANLREANLDEAVFRQANLIGVDLTGARSGFAHWPKRFDRKAAGGI